MPQRNRVQAREFLQWVLGTEDTELDCAGLMAIIDRYVESQVFGSGTEPGTESVPLHLRQCPDCGRLVAALTQLVALEARGSLPEIDELWSELRAAVSGGQSGASVAAPSGPSWRLRFASLLSRAGSRLRPATLVAVFLIAALVFAMSGWWSSARRAHLAEEIFGHLAEVDSVQSVRLGDGSRATLYFSPTRHQALVYLALAKDPHQEPQVRCWLKSGTQSAAYEEAPCGRAAGNWWFVSCDKPLANYERLGLALGAHPAATVELPLRAGGAR